LALTKGLAIVKLQGGVHALLQTQQAPLNGWGQLTRAQTQGGRLTIKGVDDDLPLGARHAVVQGQERTFFDVGHGVVLW
jgi:hypothetical protein